MTCYRYLSNIGECKEKGVICIKLDCQYAFRKSNDDAFSNPRVRYTIAGHREGQLSV